VGLIIITMACQTLNNLNITGTSVPTPTPQSWPHSTFVPPRKHVQVPAEQRLQIDSYHASTTNLEAVEIFVNGQKLVPEETAATGQTGTFPRDLADVQLRTEDDEPTANAPTAGKKITLIWVGHVPGTYELKMVATDASGRTGNPIVQLIEVK